MPACQGDVSRKRTPHAQFCIMGAFEYTPSVRASVISRLIPETLQNHPKYCHTLLDWETNSRHQSLPSHVSPYPKVANTGGADVCKQASTIMQEILWPPEQHGLPHWGRNGTVSGEHCMAISCYEPISRYWNSCLRLNKLKYWKNAARKRKNNSCAQRRRAEPKHFYSFKLGLHASANYDK